MDVKEVLAEMGLSEGEVKVYLALLKLGSSPVSALKEETKLHRTTIYDFIEKLLNKGLTNYVVRGNVKYYQATNPQRLADFLDEKASRLNDVMPELMKMSEFHKKDLNVEVFKGKEGYKAMLGLVIKEEKDLIGMGFEEEKFEELVPDTMRWYFREAKEKGIKERVFVKDSADFLYPHDNIEYKELPDEYFNPNPTMTFGDFVAIHIWDPFSTIVIKNKDLADSYRKWFEMLWGQNIKIVRGKEPVKKMFDSHYNDLKEGHEILVFGSSAHIPNYFIKYFDEYVPKLIQVGGKAKIIFDEDSGNLINICHNAGWEVKTMPRKYVSPIEVDIWKNKTAIVMWREEPVAFIIDDEEVAEGFRAFFNIQWDIAKNIGSLKNKINQKKHKSIKKVK
jgi:HTH-type transcriptional regulator, sugar sensing transcriptional regulator